MELFSDMVVGEDIILESQGESLSVTLLRPDNVDAPVPAVVMVVGSGAYSFRGSYKQGRLPFWKRVADAFLAKSYAVLFIEKKGINGSGGDWRRQSFHDRAEDVRVAVEFLRSRKEIASDKVGLCGHSQGGWIVQLVAALNPTIVAFVVMLAGPSVSVKQQILDDMKTHFSRDSRWAWVAPWRIGAAGAYLSVYAWVSRFAALGYLSRIINYDPNATAQAIGCPVLALYGENDGLVYAHTNSQLLKSQMNPQVSCQVVIIPKASHGFTLPTSTNTTPVFAPEFFEAIESWDPFAEPT